MLISKVPLLVGDSKENTVAAARRRAVGKHLLLRAMIAQNSDCPSVVSQSLWIRSDTETKMDNGAAVVGGGGRVSHLVIPEPAIDYPSFLCLSGRPVKSGGVTQTNRSVFQSVRSREYLSRDCSDSAVSSAGHLDVKRATGRRVILRTKNSLVWSKLATESARKTEFWFRFGRHTLRWWPLLVFCGRRAF